MTTATVTIEAPEQSWFFHLLSGLSDQGIETLFKASLILNAVFIIYLTYRWLFSERVNVGRE